MKERPILFSAPMVRALLAGTKTQTRRAVNPQPQMITDKKAQPWEGDPGALMRLLEMQGRHSPYGQHGDRLFVKETFYAWGHWTKRYNEKKRREEWHFVDETIGTGKAYRYDADKKQPSRKRELHEVGWWKRPSIFMPRAASRIMLEITSVRVERLQDISEADAMAEGCDHNGPCDHVRLSCEDIGCMGANSYRGGYADLWDEINGRGSWDANPWVWVINFTRVDQP